MYIDIKLRCCVGKHGGVTSLTTAAATPSTAYIIIWSGIKILEPSTRGTEKRQDRLIGLCSKMFEAFRLCLGPYFETQIRSLHVAQADETDGMGPLCKFCEPFGH